MGGIASNDAELAAILAPPVMDGLKIAGEVNVQTMIEAVINSVTGRGSMYSAGGGGSLSQAWDTKTEVFGGMTLGEMETYYDQGKETVDSERGQHITPRWINDGHGGQFENTNFEATNNLAEIIDKGLGGYKLGPQNPTRQATNFWEKALAEFQAGADGWIRSGLLAAGLPLV